MDICCFTLIIDDIVLPDGVTVMEQLGGGGPQVLFGFHFVSASLGVQPRTGLAAGIGNDLPPRCMEWLRTLGVDCSGLIIGSLPTPRAWQVFEWDGHRTQVWRVQESPKLYEQLRPEFASLPHEFQRSQNYHIGIHASYPPLQLLSALRRAAHEAGGLLSVETYTHCDTPPPPDQLRELLQLCDIFSPNEDEAASIVGEGPPQQLAARLLDAGAAVVLLRCGANGVLLARRGEPDVWQVPALPGAAVVDVTGCGNACCGGFLAALNAGLSWREAAAWGCLAGSVMAEHTGVPPAGDLQALVGDARSRWGALLHAAVSACDVSLAAAQPPGVAQAVHAPCRRSCTPLRWQLAPRRCAVAQRRRMGVRTRLPGM